MNTQDVALFNALLNEMEKENEELALALHNDILQQLLAVKLHYGIIKSKVEHLVPQDVLKAIDKQNNELSEVLDLMKYLYYSLHPASLRLLGLSKALRQAVVDFEALYDSSVQICFDSSVVEPRMDSKVRLLIYRAIVASLKIVLTKNEHTDFSLNLEYLSKEIVVSLYTSANRDALPDKIVALDVVDVSLQSLYARLLVLNAEIDERTNWCSYLKISFPIQYQI